MFIAVPCHTVLDMASDTTPLSSSAIPAFVHHRYADEDETLVVSAFQKVFCNEVEETAMMQLQGTITHSALTPRIHTDAHQHLHIFTQHCERAWWQ